MPAPRNLDYVTYTQLSLLQQRVYWLGLSDEDINDPKTLSNDPALQIAFDQKMNWVASLPS